MALTEKLTAIADAIREKGGTTELLTLDAMPDAISAIQSGGDVESFEPIVLTGLTKEIFKDNLTIGYYTSVLENSDVIFNTVDIENANEMFYGNQNVTKIPMAINFIQNGNISGTQMYYGNSLVKHIGTINNGCLFDNMFQNCGELEELPKFENIVSEKSDFYYTFAGCNKLRTIDPDVLKGNKTESSTSYNLCFNACNGLRSIEKLGVAVNATSPSFSNAFSNLWSLREFTFDTNEDGSPIVCNWDKVSITLTGRVGYANTNAKIFDTSKRITDIDKYNMLKNDLEAWTTLQALAFYNHDSVVRTLASLPDTSKGGTITSGTNIIQFTGTNGSATDGGAINTLTDEEIAVAAAKNWGVALL